MLCRFLALLIVIVLVTLGDGTYSVGHSGTCRKDTREVALKDNVLKLKDYVCRSDRDPQTQIRIQFQRLSGLAPGALLNGGAAPWQSVLYGEHQIVGNDVLNEYRNLLTRFGSPVRAKDNGGGEEIAINLSVTNPEQVPTDASQTANAGKDAEIRSFRLPSLPEIPLVDELVEILNKQTWPGSISMFYSSQLYGGSGPKSPLDDMTIWRYLTPVDARSYPERLQRYNSLVASRDYGFAEIDAAPGIPDRLGMA
jgi:hypothetical protein